MFFDAMVLSLSVSPNLEVLIHDNRQLGIVLSPVPFAKSVLQDPPGVLDGG